MPAYREDKYCHLLIEDGFLLWKLGDEWVGFVYVRRNIRPNVTDLKNQVRDPFVEVEHQGRV